MSSGHDLAKTYCNPLPIPAIPVGRNAYDAHYSGPWWREFGDPTVIHWQDRWYLFPSCGMVWWSENFRDWYFQPCNLYDVGWAPSVVAWRGALYLTASWEGSKLWRATHPLGPWECLGPIHDHGQQAFSWADPMLFADDDGALYAYYSIGVNKGLFGVRLRDDDPTRFADAPTHLFAFNPEHHWERFGEANQNAAMSHLEGAYVTRHGGRYYAQYSAAGAEWRNYAVGCYVGDQPLGPFRYQARNPILCHRGGLLNGCGHHGIVPGPDGQWWAFYTVLLRRFRGLERRIAMDPVRFDEQGEMWIDGPSETPRCLDGSYPPGVLPLSICQPATASSQLPGAAAECAVDNYARTAWIATGPCPQWVAIDLSGEYDTLGARLIFREELAPRMVAPALFRFVLEGTLDGQTWQVLHGARATAFDGHIRYLTWPAQRVRHVRVTLTEVPPGMPPGIVDLCVFGRAPAPPGPAVHA